MDMFFGLPMHALLVHLAVVVVPVAAVLVVLVAVFPKLPRLVQITTVALSAVSVLLMPMMASSGEALEQRVPDTALVEAHAEMGETLWPWTLGMLLAALGVLVLRRRTRHGDKPVGPGAQAARGGRAPWVSVALAVVAIAVAAGAIVQTVRIGHSGAQATWTSPGVIAPATPGNDDR